MGPIEFACPKNVKMRSYVIGAFNMNFFECLQLDINSCLLLIVAILGLHIIKYFSHKHKLHFLLTFVHELACLTFRHLMSYLMFWSFRFHIYLLSAVACL